MKEEGLLLDVKLLVEEFLDTAVAVDKTEHSGLFVTVECLAGGLSCLVVNCSTYG